MKAIVVELQVDAGAQALWDAVVDVDSWPRWTSSITAVTLLDGALALGGRATVEQPRLPAQTWTVSAFDAGRSFAWTTRSVGVATEGVHEVIAESPRTSRVRLSVTQRGPLAPVVGLFFGSLTRRYVGREAAGLKAAAEDREDCATRVEVE